MRSPVRVRAPRLISFIGVLFSIDLAMQSPSPGTPTDMTAEKISTKDTVYEKTLVSIMNSSDCRSPEAKDAFEIKELRMRQKVLLAIDSGTELRGSLRAWCDWFGLL